MQIDEKERGSYSVKELRQRYEKCIHNSNNNTHTTKATTACSFNSNINVEHLQRKYGGAADVYDNKGISSDSNDVVTNSITSNNGNDGRIVSTGAINDNVITTEATATNDNTTIRGVSRILPRQ